MRYAKASTLINGKEEALEKLAEEVEKDFELVGSSAIEDKLQEDIE